MPRPVSSKHQAGFNLTELMVAMVVLTISIFAVISVNAYTLRSTTGNRNRQVANMIATTMLGTAESLLKLNFHAPPSDINTPRMTSTEFPDFDFIIEDMGYEDAEYNLRAVRVRVFWQEDGYERSYQLETTFYDF